MRQDWDTRARKDAFFYIASWRKDWNESSFLQSGEDDYKHFVADVLQRHQFSPDGKSMLELGCGAGRMTRSFAQRFDRVFACDVSEEMLERARSLHREISNISWMHGNGADLTGIPSGSVDFVFSYLVLQHLPSDILFHAYVGEILRVLANGGICIFSVQWNDGAKYELEGSDGMGPSELALGVATGQCFQIDCHPSRIRSGDDREDMAWCSRQAPRCR